jgi:predicted flap endonuclease-1-like 5' DNA nuclease
MDFENMNIWCWLIPLLTGLICGIIGYYWGKGNAKIVDNSAEIKVLEGKNTRLQADLEACNKKLSVAATAAPVAAMAAPVKKKAAPSKKAAPKKAAPKKAVAFDANAAKAIFGKRIKQDDLKIVEGIGPKIEQLFHKDGIKTWKALSEASVARCQKVLDSGGDRYRIHDPGSWPRQAKMAYQGKWKQLAKWQDEHKGGKL